MSKAKKIWPVSKRYDAIFKTHIGKQLKYPHATRWKIYYDSFKALIGDFIGIQKAREECHIPAFNNSDKAYLDIYFKCFKPLTIATDKLQANCTLSYLLPILFSLKRKLDVLCRDKNKSIASLAAKLENSLFNRFQKKIITNITL